MPVFAFTKNMKSDSLRQVLDGSEVTNSDYYITYNITSAHEFSRLVWAETNWNGWDAELDCNGGDKVVIEYSVNFPTDKEPFKYTNKSVRVSDTINSNNDAADSGIIVLDIPKESDIESCRIDSRFDQK